MKMLVITTHFWHFGFAVAVKGVEEITVHQRISSLKNRIALNFGFVRIKEKVTKYPKTSQPPKIKRLLVAKKNAYNKSNIISAAITRVP